MANTILYTINNKSETKQNKSQIKFWTCFEFASYDVYRLNINLNIMDTHSDS